MLPGIFTLGLDAIDYRFIGSELIDKFLRNIADAENGEQCFLGIDLTTKKPNTKLYKTDKGVVCFLTDKKRFRIPVKRWSELKAVLQKVQDGENAGFFHGFRALSSSTITNRGEKVTS